MSRACLLAAVALLGACGPELDPSWLVTKPRIVAAVASVQGDPTRASPAAGERVEVRFEVVDAAAAPPALGWALAACLAAPTTNGDSFCDGDPFGFAAQLEPIATVPAITLDVPAGTPAGSTVLIIGAICGGGAPEIDPGSMSARCTGGAREMLVAYRLDVGTGNHNPPLADDAITLDDAPWPPSAPDADCATLPSVPLGEMRTLRIRVADDAREPEETLQLSTLTTARELERQFSVLEPETPNAPFEIEWTPDPELDAAITRPHFFVVLRDGRGGATATTRTLCITR